ncbi:hypothetical protein [Bosea massiliensis]|uniref:Thiamine biosynthesis protein ThiF n=1 Tax=Bosea massiliensis TaxID=151419 RepID=A0ABW0P5D4_9HYPH
MELREPIARALRQLANHPRVTAVGAPRVAAGGHWVVVDFDTNLPNRWKAQGYSDSGVKAIEPITFVFTKSYPADAPIIFLRDDFDRSHPHIQPGHPSVPPVPCYVDGQTREFMRLQGIRGIADQLSRWLEKAAFGALIGENDEWEPTRRDSIDDVVVFDAAAVRQLPGRDAGAVFVSSIIIKDDEVEPKSDQLSIWLASEQLTLNENAFRSLGAKGGIAPALGMIAWPGRTPSGSPFVAEHYRPETVTTLAELIERAGELGCRDPLVAQLDFLRRRINGRPLRRSLFLSIVLLARRPKTVLGQGSFWELCPYLIEIRSGDDLANRKAIPVRMLLHRDQISAVLLRRASGLTDAGERSWTLLGCGSVGSKLAVHLAREGRGPSTLVDRDRLTPHNYARHALLPMGVSEGLVSCSKSGQLMGALEGLGQKAKSFGSDIVAASLADDPAPRGKWWGASEAFLVDATGSRTVTEVLSLPTVIQERPRAIEASLLGGGKIGFMGIEGPKSNPSLLDLTIEGYRQMGADPVAREAAFGHEAQIITVGQGCSSVTSAMPDSLLGALTAPMALELGRLHRDGLPSDAGTLLLGTFASDGLSLNWNRTRIEPFLQVGENGVTRTVRLSPRVVELIDRDIALRPGVETGGVVMGRYSEIGDVFHVVDILPTPSDSKFSASEFELGVMGLSEALGASSNLYRGAIYPIGTWHNHLTDSGPSRTDVMTAVNLALAQLFPVLMLIRTPSRFRFLSLEGDLESLQPRRSSAA